MSTHLRAPGRPGLRRRAHRALTTACVAGCAAALTAGPTPPADAATTTSASTATMAAEAPAACADAVASTMTLEERVGQLFMSGVDAAAPTSGQLSTVTSRHLGGVILTGRSSRGRTATRAVSDAVRARSGGAVTAGVGLWVSTDQEGGAVQVLSGEDFSDIPTGLRQGGLPPSTLRRDAAVWGHQLDVAGVDLDLAPVLDTVPASLGARNRPIGYYDREYAHDPARVSASGRAFSAGLRDSGVQTAGKHFPGLGRVIGNTDTTAGVTDDVTVRGDAYLQPFADAVRDGIPVVMVSSARYTRIDSRSIATFSPVVIQQMLRGDIGFSGVVMSDSLGAAALADVPVADRAVRFVAAGGTVALSAQSGVVGPMVDGVLARARTDAGFRGQVDDAARTVLRTKAAAGLVACPTGTTAIAERYVALGGPGSPLGIALGPVRTVEDGAVQDFERGSLYWSAGSGAHVVQGSILAHYRALGGPSALGFPTTDERTTPDRVGRYNHFDAGAGGASVYWTPRTGAHAVMGAIRARWAALGWERSPLGYPVTDERTTPDRTGRYTHFSRSDGASIYWTPRTGAHAVMGAIRARWAALGWEHSPLGYPVTDERVVPGGTGRYNDFGRPGGASVYWSPGTGAWSVYGAVRDRWMEQGGALGPLGFPVSDVRVVPGGLRGDFETGSLTVPTG